MTKKLKEKSSEYIKRRILKSFGGSGEIGGIRYKSLQNIRELKDFNPIIINEVQSRFEYLDLELPIVLSWLTARDWCLVTTHRLICFSNGVVEFVVANEYESFGPKDINNPPIKEEGFISEYIASNTHGKVIIVKQPSGAGGIALLNVVLKFAQITALYEITQKYD